MLRRIPEIIANRALGAFAAVFLLTGFFYRIAISLSVLFAEAPPLGVARNIKTVALVLLGSCYDLLVLFGICTAFVLHKLVRPQKETRRPILALILPALLLFWHVIVLASHFNLLMTMNTGFTWAVFMEFFNILGIGGFFALLSLRDILFMVLPTTAFILLYLGRIGMPLNPHRWVILLIVASGVTFVLQLIPHAVAPELVVNPHVYLVRDAWRHFTTRTTVSKGDRDTAAASKTIYLDGPLFAEQERRILQRSGEHATAPNIIFIVLESTGTEYIFDTNKYASGKMPMPFLYALAQKSLYASKHFASNNSSPRSLFSIFSGLYESPEIKFFSMQRHLKVPHLLDHLGSRYGAFLVTPADLDWYFPKAWFKNRGFTELVDYHKLKNIAEYKAGPTSVRDEFKTAEHFLNLAQNSPGPYLGVYYSFVGHWPYPDLAPDHKLIPADSSLHRYINNLYAQDQVIEKIIRGLETSGQLQHSIVVIVGDHGEAFYQHAGNRVHSGESYNENIVAPLLIYSPRYIKPQRIDFPTVHADIVPTILSALGVPYKPLRMQGESIIEAEPPRRKYIFTYGNEDTITAVGKDMKKMQILKAKKSCRYFDLAADAAEVNNLGCPTGSEHYRALEEFARMQPTRLKAYNDFCATN